MLVAGGVLPARDEALARMERWSQDILSGIDHPADRRVMQAYLTWQVLRRLRHRSGISPAPRTPTGQSRHQIRAVAAFLAWLRQHDLALASCRQGDVETWTPTGFVDTIRSGTMVYEERTGSGTGSQEVHPGI